MKQYLNFLKQYFREVLDDTKILEMSLIALLLWWSFILILPIDTFGGATAYKAMADVASEGVWSAIFFVVAVIVIYGMISERFIVRNAGLIVSSGLWFFVAATFAVSDIATTGTGVYFVVACLNAFVVYKVGEQHGC